MKFLVALVFAMVLPAEAFAAVPCEGGSPDILKFVKWELKTVDPETTEVTLTVHNAAAEDFQKSEIKVRWGEWHQFFFKFETPAKAGSDTTFMNPFGMPKSAAEELQALTPTLCVVRTYDAAGNKKNYD